MSKIYSIIKAHKFFLIFLLIYLIIRIILLNVNYTEWGDTFRMIRGADYLADFQWPWDEKRWPLYSIFLVPGILVKSPVLWGRILSILISIFSLVLIYKLYIKYVSHNTIYAVFAAVLTASSSVYAYWSLRVMADPLFSLLILLFTYAFLENFYEKSQKIHFKSVSIMSVLLLMLTMTRLEGAFMAAGVFLFFLIKRNYRYIVSFAIPQLAIYVPWTLYAKVLYKGSVINDYLTEVQTFVFNLEKINLFVTYTLFILVIPVLSYCMFTGGYILYKKYKNDKNKLAFLPILVFITLELLIGFIWTPSLPRIYMPIIPFLVIFATVGIEKSKLKPIPLTMLILLFGILQYTQRLYFLGASKAIFLIILISSLFILSLDFIKWKFTKKNIIYLLIFSSVIVSVIVINNQRLVYKTVKQGIDYLKNSEGIVAFSDETGNSEWYLRDRSFHLPENLKISKDSQYAILKQNHVKYLLWTNEFNRGSKFEDPKDDKRYTLLKVYEESIIDPLDMLMEKIGIVEAENVMIFISKVYQVN